MSEVRYYRDLLLIFMARILEKEFGKEALDLLAEWRYKKTREKWKEISEKTGRNDPEYLFRLFSKEAHDYDVVRKDRKVLEVIVKNCVHAEVFKKFNATDIGLKLICQGDHAVVEGFNPKIKLTRPKILMAGDDCCHFKFELEE
ncbi:TPA: hypothetical protein EYP70_02885 [Candidatus Bathyarchaeota archaeon]|nr:hypothetical protein [Candidatus Bathyarchaeota archaeon]